MKDIFSAMELMFKPPRNIQDMLMKNTDLMSSNYHLFQRNDSFPIEFPIRKSLLGLIGTINEFYKLGIKDFTSNFNCSSFSGVFTDGVRNAFEHGPKDCPLVVYGLFLGDKGLCHGFCDFGDYFKNPDVKRKWEKKSFISSTKINPLGPHNVGHGIIYSLSDYLEVDVSTGILYCVQTHDSLELKPSKHFFDLMKRIK